MTPVQIISDANIWPTIRRDEQRLAELLAWLRANGIDPNEVPDTSTLSIEPCSSGHLIRYTVYLLNAEGHRYANPGSDYAASEERIAALVVPLPDTWPQPVLRAAP